MQHEIRHSIAWQVNKSCVIFHLSLNEIVGLGEKSFFPFLLVNWDNFTHTFSLQTGNTALIIADEAIARPFGSAERRCQLPVLEPQRACSCFGSSQGEGNSIRDGSYLKRPIQVGLESDHQVVEFSQATIDWPERRRGRHQGGKPNSSKPYF